MGTFEKPVRMSGTQRPFAVPAILTISLICALVYLALGVVRFAPFPARGFAANLQTGTITRVYPDGPAGAAGVRPGDRIVGFPNGNVAAGVGVIWPRFDQTYRIRTAVGEVAVRSYPSWPDRRDGAANMASILSTVILIGFAALLYARRPGPMAFAFWLYAVLSLSFGALSPLFHRLPAEIGAPTAVVLGGLFGWAYAVPLIPFALRFPNDRASRRGRRAEAIAWICFGVAFIAGCGVYASSWAGWIDQQLAVLLIYLPPALPLPIAAAILIRKYLRETATARAQTAWALAGFAGAFVCELITQFEGSLQAWFDPLTVYLFYQILTVATNLLPLLAIYPILRFRLFDLGFVVNRATLYSVLTLAALAALAGANWLAQRLVTERMAIVVQPLAAIVIGLGYFRVRALTQSVLERFLFRERFAAERRIEAMARGLALATSTGAIDETLTTEVAEALSLRSAVVFRNWNDEMPAPPSETVLTIVLERAGRPLGIVFYGRHRNGTEIDPEEVRMLQRLCDAAAAVYETVELRVRVDELSEQIDGLRAIRL